MRVYVAHPITGLSFDEVVEFYETSKTRLEKVGYTVFHPMTGKEALRTEKKFRSEGYGTPISSNHAIYARDQWMVRQADVVLAIMDTMDKASVGISMELAWAQILGKHVVVALKPGSGMDHAFVREAASIEFYTREEAFTYLETLIKGKV